jgi:hypothetical protein
MQNNSKISLNYSKAHLLPHSNEVFILKNDKLFKLEGKTSILWTYINNDSYFESLKNRTSHLFELNEFIIFY